MTPTLEQGFWQAYQRFLKTTLITEQPNPQTAQLSELAKSDLPKAYAILQKLDLHAIDVVIAQQVEIEKFKANLAGIAKQKGRLILVGCGASGRIAAQVEYWAQLVQNHKDSQYGCKVEAVLAGGDITLIEAIESCEDNPEFARKQMALLNLTENDWVIGLSASGEAPYILEALHFAQSRTKQKPVLICCNSIEALLERDPNHLAGDARFEVISLIVGEMALTGSTRMQATTAMTLFLVLALFEDQFNVRRWRNLYASLDFSIFCGLTIWEASHFQKAERVTYHATSDMALPILADLTERAPTFNLPRIYHQGDAQDRAPVGLILDDADNAKEAWYQLLDRAPKALNFIGFAKTSMDYLLGFDLSKEGIDSLWKIDIKKAFPELLDIRRRNDTTLIEIHFLLRLILVNHSTLVMGRCGFYTGNLMTSLKPANFKLIDRAIRYVQFLYAQKYAKEIAYREVAEVLFALIPNLKPQESIVFRVLEVIEHKAH